jgi:hypothetical protein
MPSSDFLNDFEIAPPLVKPALEACRLYNTAFDALFYDLPTLVQSLRERGEAIATLADDDAPDASGRLNLSALKNPEGSLLVIDAAKAPYVRAFHDVQMFLDCEEPVVRDIAIASITGVGSSALGSAALAWNISVALEAPVLAIVPGYGVADAVLQGLGGWYGFGLYDFLNSKSHVQTLLATVAPRTASIGRQLSDSSPGSRRLANGGPVFRTGCGSSDVLHDLMERRPINCVVGHSKGALAISNALHSLEPSRTAGVKIVTLGCPVAEDAPGARYHQFLGLFDALGALNAWGHMPNAWVVTDHSTNASIPLSMHAEALVADRRATAATPNAVGDAAVEDSVGKNAVI